MKEEKKDEEEKEVIPHLVCVQCHYSELLNFSLSWESCKLDTLMNTARKKAKQLR